MEHQQIVNRLNVLGFSPEVLSRYVEHHRYYHTIEHISTVLDVLHQQGEVSDPLFLAAVFHDAVYDPRWDDNEERSADYFEEQAAIASYPENAWAEVRHLILATKTHHENTGNAGRLNAADLDILNSDYPGLLEFERKVFLEYQFMPLESYRAGRIRVLNDLVGLSKTSNRQNLDQLINYVRYYQPLIGVFAGSFNPFHLGHYNVLQKAEKIFDKVIIALGRNPDKNERTWDIPSVIRNRQIETYHGLLTDFVGTLTEKTVVIRGLRNSTDFQYEQNQYRYIQELMPDIRIVNIFCDKEFEHISSSGIRTLEKFDRHRSYLLE